MTMPNPYSEPDTAAQINLLQQQQALFTQIVKDMLEGKWAGGADTAEALLYALDPNMTGTLSLDTPVTQSEYSEPPKA
jgi:hypothetical protein